ncbi:hypothetical protein [Celeribacter neptunius]|uniref:Uncharacterized protein n=1 Tax=Celeribacter neptunius TaxID=588602 RepID=A0A1I3VA71_9RHOB|nr:hypothetical protein [Celeribacter neptunius]SFJ91031.1 hypothetical protein SAMN04487991_3237 [Celeribacter neptunius]
MKNPTIDWENSSDEFIAAFEMHPEFSTLDRGDVEAILKEDVARAQRMAAAGLRHLRTILGANRNAGKLDRWRRDALAPLYFGKASTVVQIRSTRHRLERAHRRLRDNRLHLRMREQRHAGSGTNGRNPGYFLSPNRFQLFPEWAKKDAEDRAAILVHELLHEWLSDQKIGRQTVYGEDLARRLAREDPGKARRSPENFEHFLLQVWRDEGLEAPSGAEKLDTPLKLISEAPDDATGLLADRPVLTPATMGGRRDLAFCALRARSGHQIYPAIFEYDARPIRRRSQDGATGETSFPAACCTLPDGTVIAAVRGTGSKRLKLIAWSVENEQPERIADSGDIYGDVYSQPDIIALGGGQMCVCFKIKNGRMKVDLVEYSSSSGFRRYGSAETSGPIHDHGRACLVSPVDEIYGLAGEDAPNEVVIATAFRTREGQLSMDLWTGNFGRREVRRQGGIADRTITGRPGIAALTRGREQRRVVTAARDEATGRLWLTCFEVDDPARPRRMGDSGLEGPRMSHSPDIVTVTEGFSQQLATAIRYSENGRIIVSTWSAPDDSDNFIRHRHSSSDTTPMIDSTPSLMAVEGQQSEDLLTSAIGANGRLALQLWGEP